MKPAKIYPLLILVLILIIIAFLVIGTSDSYSSNKQFHTKYEPFDNRKYKYIPNKNIPTVSIESGVADIADEVASAIEFIKVDNELISVEKVNPDTMDEYSKPVTDLEINKMYTALTADITVSMDKIYGDLFNLSLLSAMSDRDIWDAWNTNDHLKMPDEIYSQTYSYYINDAKSPYKKRILMDVFSKLVIASKSDKLRLESIKTTFYGIMKPAFLTSSLLDNIIANKTRYKTADENTNNTAIFALNTCRDLVNKIYKTDELDRDLMVKSGAATINDAPVEVLNIDGIKVFQAITVGYYVAKFATNKEQPFIKMTQPTFATGFPKYLEKKGITKGDKSAILFLLKYPPVTS